MLVDTSVWIDFLRPRARALKSDELEELSAAIVDGEATIVLLIYAELLSGAKHADRELRDLLGALRFIDLDWTSPTVWESVAQLATVAHGRSSIA